MTTLVVGTYKNGTRHRSIVTARRKAYELLGDRKNASVSITELNSRGYMKPYNYGLISRGKSKDTVYFTKYDGPKVVGQWVARKNGSLGERIW